MKIEQIDRVVWSRSVREEIISALWLIAALLAWIAGIKWLAWCLFVKSASDTVTAILFAVKEALQAIKKARRNENRDH
ncbi:MAG: hypothetical protein ACTHLW_20345 [Verrucomicrobiota bacterium]